MAKSEFENLQVYQLAEDLADRIWEKEDADILAPIIEALGPKLNAYHQSLTPRDSE